MEELIGTIKMFAGDFAPRGWEFCHGQILQIRLNQALFSILGKRYGGDGISTFALPDLRGRTPIGVGNETKNYHYSSVGTKGGSESVSFDTAKHLNINIPAQRVTGSISVNLADDTDIGHVMNAGNMVIAQQTGASGISKALVYRAAPTFNDNNYLHDQTVEANLKIEEVNETISVDFRPEYSIVNFIIAVRGNFPQRPY